MRHILLTSRLDARHGGLTASLLRKAGVTARRLGLAPIIATFHDAPAFPQLTAEIRERYKLPPEVSFANINHHYRDLPGPPGVPPGQEVMARFCADLPPHEVIHMPGAVHSPYAATVSVEGQPVRRFWFRRDGTVYQIRDLAPSAGKAGCGPAGAGGQRGGAGRRADGTGHEVVLDPLTKAEQRFRTVDGFRRHFMNELCQPPVTYLVCEARGLDGALLGLENRWARKIFVFHSIHTRPGSDVLRSGNRSLLRNLEQADALVVLTQAQRLDIARRFGRAERIHVIPHAIEPGTPGAAGAAGAADAPGAAGVAQPERAPGAAGVAGAASMSGLVGAAGVVGVAQSERAPGAADVAGAPGVAGMSGVAGAADAAGAAGM
ncbi:MAG: hypothetical protein LBE08_09560, partial [Bifidobacteriaceae bacterium]|nr:hypothetical protein [Bifidobacteriaceae bacterium]